MMPIWRQALLLTSFASAAGLALFVALGPARHRAAIRRRPTVPVFILLVVFAGGFIGAAGTPPLLQIAAAGATLTMLVAVPLAWRRAGRERA
jgi:hypothetical protein